MYSVTPVKTVVVCSDFHLTDHQPVNRVSPCPEAGLKKLDYMLKRCAELNAIFISNGDTFAKNCPTYAYTNEVIGVMKKYPNVLKMVTVGSHDLIGNQTALEDTAIFTLINSGVVSLLGEQVFVTEDFVIAGKNYDPNFNGNLMMPLFDPELVGAGRKQIMITHQSIVPAPVIYDHVLTKDVKTDADLVLLGHIHQQFVDKQGKTTFISPGCIVRHKINEKDHEPAFMIVTKGGVSFEKIPCDPVKWNEETVEDVVKTFSGNTQDIKMEGGNIDEIIKLSTFAQPTKDHSLERIHKVRNNGKLK